MEEKMDDVLSKLEKQKKQVIEQSETRKMERIGRAEKILKELIALNYKVKFKREKVGPWYKFKWAKIKFVEVEILRGHLDAEITGLLDKICQKGFYGTLLSSYKTEGWQIRWELGEWQTFCSITLTKKLDTEDNLTSETNQAELLVQKEKKLKRLRLRITELEREIQMLKDSPNSRDPQVKY